MDLEQNYANSNPNRWRRRLRSFLGICCWVLYAVAGVIFLYFYINWVWFQPGNNQIIEINSLSFGNYNYSSSTHHLTSTWNASFQLYNHNEVSSVDFYDAVFSVLYRDNYITGGDVPTNLHMEKQTGETAYVMSVSNVDSYVDSNVEEEINRDRSSGMVNFTVKFTALLQLERGGFKGYGGEFKAVCPNVLLGGSLKEMLQIKSNEIHCRVDVLPY